MKKWPLTSLAGFATIVVYLVFTLVAFLAYPGRYTPLTNWLSDLGNPQVNAVGAVYYNTGCILTGIGLALVSFGLLRWNFSRKRTKVILLIGIAAGVLASVSLILAAVFPLGPSSSLHSFWSKMVSGFLGFFLTFTASALMRHAGFNKGIAFYAFLAALVNFIYGVFLYSVFIAEWISIGMFIVYIFLVSFESYRLKSSISEV